MTSVLEVVAGLAPRMVLDPDQRAMLAALSVVAQQPHGDGVRGQATSASATTLPGLCGVTLGAGTVGFDIAPLGAGGATLDVTVDGPALGLEAGGLLRAATATTAGDGVRRRTRLTPSGGPLVLTAQGGSLLLRLSAPAAGRATFRAGAHGGGALRLTCSPPDLLLPGDVGLRLPQGLTLEPTGGKSIRAPDAALVLPPALPLVGGLEVPLTVGFAADGGLDADVTVDAPPVTGRLRWHDPTARHLADLIPTGGEVALDIPVSGQQAATPAGPVRLDGPARVSVRARFARDPNDPARAFKATVGVDTPGSGGLLRVTAGPGDLPGRVAVTAFAVAAAVLADAVPGGEQGIPAGARLAALLGAAGAIGATLTEAGGLVLHGVMFEAGTGGAAVSLDLSAAVSAVDLRLGPLTIGMQDDRPLRVRWRGVRLAVDPTAASPDDRFAVGFAGAQLDVEDPGGWTIDSPGNLLDVVGTRSGHGSTWVEVDLRFALDLGPVKVSGATIRASFAGGAPSLALRGLDAEVDVPHVVEGGGKAAVSEQGFELAARASIVPLGLGVLAIVRSATEHDGPVEYRRTELVFGVDLPGPVPLGPTGLGLFGALGAVGINATMPSLDGPGGIERLIGWRPWEPLQPRRGSLTLGAGLVIGTAPDLAFTLSALAYLGVTVPDLALRAGLDATVLQGRQRLAALGGQGPPSGPELRITGALAADGAALTLGMRATYRIPVLLEVVVPVGARYPYGGANWYVHLGTDGHPSRPPGPVSARVLPDLLDVGGWGFVMVHGDGIPDVAGTGRDLGGFALAAGIGATVVLGVPPLAWADISAHFVAAVASDPFVLIVKGGVSGGLHLGPFSLGISADADLQVGPGDSRYLKVRVCGEIDLWLTSISGCVQVETGTPVTELPDPSAEAWPFPRVTLADGHGQTLLGPDEKTAVEATGEPSTAPEVWPDAIPLLTFPVAPVVAVTGLRAPSPPHIGTTGSEQLAYTWTLEGLSLDEVASSGATTPVSIGTLATWQDSPDLPGGAVGTSLPRQLALLTAHTALWTRTAADGGRSRPLDRDPVETASTRCFRTFQPRSSWALGTDAVPAAGARWRLPPEGEGPGAWPRVLFAATAASVGVLVDTRWPEGLPGWPEVRGVGVPGVTDPGGPLRYADPLTDDPCPRSFRGALRLPHLRVSPEVVGAWSRFTGELPDTATATFTFEELVSTATLVLLVPREAVDRLRCSGVDDHGNVIDWPIRVDEVAEGLRLVRVTPSDDGLWRSLTLRHPVWAPVDVLGLELLADQAVSLVEFAGRSAKGQAAATGTAHAGAPGVANRLVLKSGTTYRIRVRLAGTKSAPGRSIGPIPVAFPDEFPGPQTREYWFRTARPVETSLGLVGPGLVPVFWRRDRFSVDYLERYLLGYTPVDRATWWFTGDPVEAHFSAEHLVALAAAYGREVKLSTRRTDTPPGGPDPGNLLDPQRLWLLLVSIFAGDRRFTEAAPLTSCPLPKSGATLRGNAELAPRATYDLAAAFPRTGLGAQPGDLLPGVVFTTSRWGDPLAAMADLRLTASLAAPGTSHGDLLVQSDAGLAPGTLVSDGAFADALRRLGLDALPPPAGPRTSVLWARSVSGWALSGLLLEADEPLHRPDAEGTPAAQRLDRMLLTSAAVNGTALPVHRRDRSGARLLWLASTPLPGPATIRVAGSQQPLRGGAMQPLGGSLLAPPVPAFAEVMA